MTTEQSTDLADFLLDRIAEDEALATEARRDALAFSSVPPYAKLGFAAGDLARQYDPARVLAECDAKRRILELHRLVTEDYAGRWWTDPGVPGKYVTTGCDHCRSAGADGDEYLNDGPCETLRLLALPYADHPDYDESWRP